MNGSSSTYMNKGSRMLVGGIPSPLTYMLHALGNSPSILATALNEAINDEVSEIKKEVTKKNSDYQEIMDFFDISYDAENAQFVYGISAPYGDTARNLEYGGPESAANPVLRKAAISNVKRLEKRINTSIDKQLGKK
jgi:hypothetical protein